MDDSDPTLAQTEGPGANAQAYSVSELAFALKRTLEDAYGFVRVRGEVSKVTRHASGHVYLTIKDDRASIDGVVWRASVRGLGCQPETGLEVVATGRISTYPARSSYQLIIDQLAPAGEGALLAQLERLKARLRAEGLFDAGRKKPLPPYPEIIAVVTSPTGAVMRDILHRIADRWPTRILLWPVLVQGQEAARQVAAAVEGLNRLGGDGDPPRPDVIIVARGGGSVEDLWPFNDERLARTIAASRTPVISAVGHETDVTLIDFVADRRAPTPTAAAEMATPVIADLRAALADGEHRLIRATQAAFALRRSRLSAAARGLPRPADVVGYAAQRFDLAQGRLAAALRRNLAVHERSFLQAGARLAPHLLDRGRILGENRLETAGRRLRRALDMRLERLAERLDGLEQLRRSYDPDRPLTVGFARVHRGDGELVRSSVALERGEPLRLVFKDGARTAVVDDDAPLIRREPSQRDA